MTATPTSDHESAKLAEIERIAGGLSAVPIEEQCAEVEREIRSRLRLYPGQVARGRLKPDSAARKIHALRAAQTSLAWLAANADWVRAAAKARADAAHDLAAVEAHPVVQQALTTFPGASVAKIRRPA